MFVNVFQSSSIKDYVDTNKVNFVKQERMTFRYTTLEFLWQTACIDHILVGIEPFSDFWSSLSYNYQKYIAFFLHLNSDFFLCTVSALSWYLKQGKLHIHPAVSKREKLIRKTHILTLRIIRTSWVRCKLNMPISIGRWYHVYWQVHWNPQVS